MMKWIEAKIIYDSKGEPFAVDMIADIFYNFGLKGVVVEDPDIEPTNEWVDASLNMPRQHSVAGYFPKDELTGKRRRAFEKALIRSQKECGIVCRIIYNEIDEQDWSESWKNFFWPERVGSRMVVKPTWREYTACADEIIIEIDPGMAFGTGTHPTSRLCIDMMEKYLQEGDSILDVGTGSGILIIAAAKLGAGRALGVDIDKSAVAIARNNLLLNGISSTRYEVRTGDLVDRVIDRFNIVVANISKAAVLTLLDKLKKVMLVNGVFICSGMLKDNVDEIVGKMGVLQLTVLEIHSEKEWVSITCRF